MRVLRAPIFPAPPGNIEPELQRYLAGIQSVIRDLAAQVYADVSEGGSHFQVKTAAPAATAIDEGQIMLVNGGAGADQIVTKVDGTVGTVDLT